MNTDGLKYFIMSNSRRHTTVNRPSVPGEIAWLKSPANVRGYALYQDMDHTTPYGRLTLEMCAIAQVDYNYFYRQATRLPSYQSYIRTMGRWYPLAIPNLISTRL
jgi:hypothetical protein